MGPFPNLGDFRPFDSSLHPRGLAGRFGVKVGGKKKHRKPQLNNTATTATAAFNAFRNVANVFGGKPTA